MAEQRGLRKLTRADIVIVGVVCLLLILLVPVLFAKPREQAIRKVCAANLAQIGKAMFLYAGDNEGALPRAGGPSTVWGTMLANGWTALDRRAAFGLSHDGEGGVASINSSFYLLVKYLHVSPRLFVCAADRGTTEFKLSGLVGVPADFGLSDAWDFGPPYKSAMHCSYAYHIPYSLYALNTSLDPNLAVAADRNPWIASPASAAGTWADFRPDITYPGGPAGKSEYARRGNSITHQRDGQNVLFLDGRVTFEKRAYCAVDKDNIYTISCDVFEGRGDPYGMLPVHGSWCAPTNRKDSVLVHDPPTIPDTRKR